MLGRAFLDFFFSFLHDPREGDEESDRRHGPGEEVSDPFGKVDPIATKVMAQKEAEGNQNDDFPENGQEQGTLRLAQGHVDVLKGHLHEEHDRTHQEERGIGFHQRGDLWAGGKDDRVDLGEEERKGPSDDGVSKSQDGHVADAFFESLRVPLPVDIAHEGLHAIAHPVEGERNQLEGAQHDGHGRGEILVSPAGPIQIDVEHDLDQAFGGGHDERGKP